MSGLWIVIPAKDEAKTIGTLVAAASQYGTVLVVDDGSKDDTRRKAAKAGALMLHHAKTQGIVPSIRDGWREALAGGADQILVMDAGGSHRARDIPMLLMADKAAIVVGSRFLRPGSYVGPRWRGLCSRLMALLCNLAQSGKWIRDWTSGFRLYSAGAVRQLLRLRYQAKMHGWQMEMLGWARHLNLTIAEVPIAYTAGRSSLSWSGVVEASNVWMAILHHRQGRR